MKRRKLMLMLLKERDKRYKSEFRNLHDQNKESRQSLVEAREMAKTMLDTALASSEKAVLKAEAATERRFESVNEFRSTLTDQQATFARTAEIDVKLKALEKEIDASTARHQHSVGEQQGGAVVWYVVGILVSMLLSVASLIVTVLVK